MVDGRKMLKSPATANARVNTIHHHSLLLICSSLRGESCP